MIIFTYLITRDLVETLENKFGYGLGSLKTTIKRFEEDFLNRFSDAIPEKVNVEIREASSMIINLSKFNSNYPILSLDRVYFPFADYFLDVTRITDPRTCNVSIGERSGAPPLEDQIKSLEGIGSVCLGDVGAFEGDTLLDVVGRLGEKGIVVEEVLLGYVGNTALNRLGRNLKYLQKRNFYEWIELRDFFGIDGRNLRTYDGKRRFIPYWENLGKWASISEDKVNGVRDLCFEFNSKLVGLLWREGFDLSKMGVPNKLVA